MKMAPVPRRQLGRIEADGWKRASSPPLWGGHATERVVEGIRKSVGAEGIEIGALNASDFF